MHRKRNSAKVLPFNITFGRGIGRNAVQHDIMMMLGDDHLGIGLGPESVCLENQVLLSSCKITIRNLKM